MRHQHKALWSPFYHTGLCHEARHSQTKELCCTHNSFFVFPKVMVPVATSYKLKHLIYRYPNVNCAFKLPEVDSFMMKNSCSLSAMHGHACPRSLTGLIHRGWGCRRQGEIRHRNGHNCLFLAAPCSLWHHQFSNQELNLHPLQ